MTAPQEWCAFFWCLALTTVRIGEILALQRKDVDLEGRKIKFGRNVWRGQVQDSTKTGEVYEKYVTDRLLTALKAHLDGKNLGPDDFVFYRSERDRRPLDPDYVRREILYPALQRAGVQRIPRASGFHAFRRAIGKHLRKIAGLEVASVQLSHKSMATTDEHYNGRDRDDIVRAA
ncbi:MAG: site-specific integrase, partial [Acidobacteria bacterium]|nr:site-specific integrase [Acidobacteriota bacterium]